MTAKSCRGSRRPFAPGTLSRDGEVAQCSACSGNYYVTDDDVIEPHPRVLDRWWKRCLRCRKTDRHE